MSPKKTYVFDTSVLICDPFSYNHFRNSEVIIPIVVLTELDKLKKQSNDAGKKARVAIRALDEISNNGLINVGVLLENDTLLKIDVEHYEVDKRFGDPTYGDTKILSCAYAYFKIQPDNVTLVSNDINLRVLAKSLGIDAISYEKDGSLEINDIYTGTQTVVNPEAGEDLIKNGFIDPRLYQLHLLTNEFVSFTDGDGNIISKGRKVSPSKLQMVYDVYPWRISAKNTEQSYAMNLIMDKSIDLVTLIGKAGCGKSIVALACALDLVLSQKLYDKLVIYRPIQSVGKDLGYMPGTYEEKVAPWFQAVMDNFEQLFPTKNGGGSWQRDFEMYKNKGLIEFEAITFIRGRSIPNTIILVEEAQNLSNEDVKTILTRAGKGTKIILNGDIEQIDNSYLDATNNGLVHIIDKFKGMNIAGHVTFVKGERSRLATLAASIL